MKRGLKILLLADTWATFAVGMLGPIYAIFVEDIGGDLLDASWAYFSFMITSGVVMHLISHWEDRYKHKEKLVTYGYLLTAFGCLLYVFVHDQMTLILTQIVLGLAEATSPRPMMHCISAILTKIRMRLNGATGNRCGTSSLP
ncbi:MAG: MFS transporter [archaeon]